MNEKWIETRNPSEGLSAVKDPNGRWGFIDSKGNIVCPCQWEAVGDFNEGLS